MQEISLAVPRAAHNMNRPSHPGGDQVSDRHTPVLHTGRKRRRHRHNREGFIEICGRRLDLSPTSEVLLEGIRRRLEEYEMERARPR
jgi:hypothetical protein